MEGRMDCSPAVDLVVEAVQMGQKESVWVEIRGSSPNREGKYLEWLETLA